jgi:hypothetical protein
VKHDRAAVLSDFDEQVRRSLHPDGSGAVAERAGPVIRWSTVNGEGWGGIVWSDLDEGTADEVIADQVRFFAGRGEPFEWKLFSYDRPPDLGRRLLAAGLVPEDPESLMLAGTSEVARLDGRSVTVPDGVRLVPVTDEAGIGLMIEVHDQVFGPDPGLRGRLTAQLTSPSGTNVLVLVLAMAGDEPVASARIEFGAGSDFAGLWRRRGIYRAMVVYRARLAAARGYRYLQVDASAQSRPILERLGFDCLAVTTPYAWAPG